MKVPYCRIACDGNELAYVREVLASGWLTTGAKALELERRFAEVVQAGHAIAVNSCTSALHLALEALGVKAGDEVFVPTMTFTASAEVIRYMNAHPVFLDVEYGTSLLTPGIVREAIREHPGVKTLVVVHYGGQAAPLFGRGGEQGILEICRQHGIRVVEDAAHAFPTKLGDAMVGSIGDVTCFSFYANKTITTGEGGMLTTNDAAIAARARTMRLHGIDRVVWDRFTSAKPGWEYDVVAPGFKYNMPDINAAIGLAQLERAWDFQRERLRCAKHYLRDLAGAPHLDLPVSHGPVEDQAWHLFPVVLKPGAPVGRSRCVERLAEKGIGTSVHYRPLHRMSYYRDTYHLKPEDFPQAERIWSGCFSLPIFPTLGDDELSYVCGVLRDILEGRE
ncbi:MAG: DegT/DnrJ/EryC1/StrS family aminotransferase [Candidatus Aminicenantales bacterium]